MNFVSFVIFVFVGLAVFISVNGTEVIGFPVGVHFHPHKNHTATHNSTALPPSSQTPPTHRHHHHNITSVKPPTKEIRFPANFSLHPHPHSHPTPHHGNYTHHTPSSKPVTAPTPVKLVHHSSVHPHPSIHSKHVTASLVHGGNVPVNRATRVPEHVPLE
uniref:Transmembrane protein n=1 Tax=Panagrellus redivivus TaxID=6233 RepID=A0A7E4ZSE1_PANRE